MAAGSAREGREVERGVRMHVPCVFPVGRRSQDHVVLVKQTHLFHVAGAWPRSWDLDVRSLSPAVTARVCWGRCVPGSTRALMASWASAPAVRAEPLTLQTACMRHTSSGGILRFSGSLIKKGGRNRENKF